jgi:hypothetical protein
MRRFWLRQNDGVSVVVAGSRKECDSVVLAGDVAEGEMDEREAGAEGSYEAFHALDALFVIADAAFQVVQTAGLAYAHELIHLAL